MPADNVATDDLLGVTIAGRYRVISRLGAGGMGVAYRAWDEQGGLPVVIKIPKRSFLEDSKFAERFYREIRLLQGLKHSHIVPIVDVGEHEGLPFVVMRFLPGGSLSNRRLRDEQGKPRQNSPETLHLWLPAIAEALDYVHSQGVVHRDVKPGNIFFDAFWGAYLGDFGIAKIVEETDTFDKEHTLTATHMGIGTPDYMAPEQFTPKAVIDGKADQYALGVIVYEMLAGKRPFTGDTAHIVVEVTTQPVPALPVPWGQVPPRLAQSVHRALAKHPSQRFGTCREFAAAALRDVQPMTDEPGVARLLCPQCSNMLKLPTAAAGQKGKCPKCQTQMKVGDDLGALWLLDEARKQRKAAELGGDESPRTPSGGVDKDILNEFKPVSSETPIPRRKNSLPQPLVVVGAAIVLLALLVVAIGLFGGTIEPPPPPPPSPPSYEVRLDRALQTLERDSLDQDANDFVARHYCFKERNWEKGLAYLAKSAMKEAATLATEEIAAKKAEPINPGTMIRLARKWWDYGGRTDLNTPESAAATRLHAKDIYAEHVEKIIDQSDADWANQWLDSDKNFAQLVKNLRPVPRVVLKAGLLASLYKYQQGEPGGFLPTDFAGKADEIAVHPQIAFQPLDGIADFSIKDRFHVVWSGIIRIKQAGLYKFFLNSDDGSKLMIDTKLVIDNGGLHGMTEKAGQITLETGDHALNVELFEEVWGTGCILSWEPPNRAKEVVPASVLFHDPALGVAQTNPTQQKVLYLADMPVKSSLVGWGDFKKGRIADSHINGNDHDKLLSAHAASRLLYELPKNFDGHLSGAVALADLSKETRTPGSCRFRVLGDEKVLWQSGTISQNLQTGHSVVEKFEVKLRGINFLSLEVDPLGAISYDRSVWVDPVLVWKGTVVNTRETLPTTDVLIQSAIKWLVDHQANDGSWDFDLKRCATCSGQCSQAGSYPDRAGATALALLAILSQGYTHRDGPYQKEVHASLDYLIKCAVEGQGKIHSGGTHALWVQAWGTLALTQCYSMTQDKVLGKPAQLALDYIMATQDPAGGGWSNEVPNAAGNTLATGWQLESLRSGHLAYLQVNPLTIKKAVEFLNRVQGDDGAMYGSTDPGNGYGTSAVGLLCRMYLGWKKDNPVLQRGVLRLAKAGPTADLYYNLHVTKILNHLEGDAQVAWNSELRRKLSGFQVLEGHETGSWWEGVNGEMPFSGGRLYCTALAAMILQMQGVGADAKPAPGSLMRFQSLENRILAFNVVGSLDGGALWGSNPYTADSRPAMAVHAGVLKPGEAGTVRIKLLPGQPSYPGSTQNGVTSSAWGLFSFSYRVETSR